MRALSLCILLTVPLTVFSAEHYVSKTHADQKIRAHNNELR